MLKNRVFWGLIGSVLVSATVWGQPVLRIAYFVPSDREPCANYGERLEHLVTEVQTFYRKGMQAQGHGPLTFTPDRKRDGTLRILMVKGKHPMRTYGRDGAGAVANEVRQALHEYGLDMSRETVLLFQVLLEWRGDKAMEVGPFCGGGDHRQGVAWVYDDALLDARRLAEGSPGGYYHGPCSIGQFNTHYIGGLAHELGHALGLPHDREAKNDPRGYSLMGGGNHTYGKELRGEGRGAFLSAASALPLVCHPLFNAKVTDVAARCTSELVDLQTSFKNGKLSVKGRLVVQPAAYGVVAYNDWTQIPGDYDALGLAGKLNKNGEFGLVIDELQPGQWDLRLRVCHLNGGQSHLALRYQVDAEGKVEADELRHFWRLAVATQAFAARDVKKMMAETQKITATTAPTSAAHRKALHLQHLLRPPVPLTLTAVPDTQASVLLSRLTFEQAAVGWRQPLRDRVPTDEGRACLLEVAGQFFEDGLYAHAPSRYVFNLKGQWQALKGQMGVQDGFAGSVCFVIKGDGRELLRSKVVKEGELERFTIDVSGIQQLELITEDGGDGTSSDWGVWLAPSLHRTL